MTINNPWLKLGAVIFFGFGYIIGGGLIFLFLYTVLHWLGYVGGPGL